MIDNLEFMNVNSINALLKILEEPNHKIYFLLIHNSNEKIYNTLRSRCLPFKINLSFHQSINIANNLLNKDIMNLLNIELMSYYNTPGDFINLINFAEENNLDLSEYSLKNFLLFMINENLYKKSNFVKFNIFSYIELYFLKIFMQNSNKNLINKFYSSFIKKIDTTNKFNLDYESLFIEFKSKILNA